MSKTKRKSNIFEYELLDGEEILWMDKPQAWKLFNAHDLYLIPFSLFWCGFALFWMSGASRAGLFALFGLPHVLVGLYMLIGRFIVKYMRNRNTYYAVTNHRILITTRLLWTKFHAFSIDTLPALEKSVGVGGIGTISFGIEPQQPWWGRRRANYSNTGMELFGYTLPGFYDIANANEVYRLISELRHSYSLAPVQNYDEADDIWQPRKRKALR
jgi:hypothetical protein